jgi:biopolymer transport protein ExbB
MPLWFTSVGIMAWPLLVMSVIACTLLLERIHCYCLELNAYRLSRLGQGQLIHALQQQSTLEQGEAWSALWLQHGQAQWKRRLPLLSLIGSLAPLLGLMGTVWGLILMFRDIAATKAAVTPALLANGLWEAMYSTMAGLAVAIPCLLMFGLLNAWRARLSDGYVSLLNQHHFKQSFGETFAQSCIVDQQAVKVKSNVST